MSDTFDLEPHAGKSLADSNLHLKGTVAKLPLAVTIDDGVPVAPPSPPEALTQYHQSAPEGSDSAADPPFNSLGDYEILSEIARGGMGVVYKARHRKLNRMVALKVTRAGHLSSDAERKRFQSEVEAAGQLDHQNIVPVYEAGEAEGRHFFSMALIEGPSLAERVADRPLAPREAADLIRQAAAAVAYAHGHGVVHRDLKPANILVDAGGQPRITDFGLAKRTDADSSLTQAGQIMGTPNFMPPEQAEGKNAEVGPLADVYSLGATLYCLLTGRPPFQAATVIETLKQVVEREPVAPRALNPAVPSDLDTICLKCLRKQPERRYGSASELVDDLQRFLDHRPIAARPVGTVERSLRWCRRNPALAGSAAAVMVAFLAAFVLVSGSYYRAEELRQKEADQRAEAERKEKAERWERYRSNLIAAGSAMRLHNVTAARDALEVAPKEHRGWEWRHFYHQIDQAAHFDPGFGSTSIGIASPDRRTIISFSGADEGINFFDPVARRLLFRVSDPRHSGIGRFSRDSKLAAVTTLENTVDVWNLAERQRQTTLKGHTDRVDWLGFHPDGTRLVTGSADRTVRVWDAATGKQLLALVLQNDRVGRVCFSADGKRIITHSGRTSCLWNATTGELLGEYPAFPVGIVGDIVASPVGELLAIAEEFPSNRIRVLDLTTNRVAADMVGHTNQTIAFAFSLDVRQFASCGYDQTVRLWDPRNGKLLNTLTGHAGWVNSLDFSPDGARLVSASQDQTVRLWEVKTGAPLAVLHGHTSAIEFVTYTPDGQAVVAIARDGAIRWFDVRMAEQNGAIRGHSGFVYGVAFHPDGERVASAAWDGTVRIWNATNGLELAAFKHADKTIVTAVTFHPDGRHLVSQGRDDDVHLWDLQTGKLVHRFPLSTQLWRDSRLAFSRDGKLLAAGAKDNTVHVWDFASRKEIAVLKGHIDFVRDLVFGPDANWLATAGEAGDNSVRIWDLVSGRELRTLTDHTNAVYALALSPDGKTLASGSHDGDVRLWDANTWDAITVLKQGTNTYGLAFSPDGKRLACACANNTIRLWDVATGMNVAELHGHSDYVHQVAFSPDGSRLVSGSGDMMLRIWDTLPAAKRAGSR